MTYEPIERHDAGNGYSYTVQEDSDGKFRVNRIKTDTSGKTTVAGHGSGPYDTAEEGNRVAQRKAEEERMSNT